MRSFRYAPKRGENAKARLKRALAVSFAFLSCARAQISDGILESVPLDMSLSETNSQTLYQELNPENTGMANFENNFESPRIWGNHWRTYLFGAIGTGVAIGDVDADGKPDVFVVSKNDESRLYRNNGDFRFSDITEKSGIDEKRSSGMDKNETPGGGAAFADIDNDGDLDLYLCYLGAPNQLWINDGSGRFEERANEWGIDVSAASVMGHFVDYDRDGLLDMYLATNLLQEGDVYPGPEPDKLFRNIGDRFIETTSEAGISGEGHAHSAVWWDFNGDGHPDIYVANDFAGVDKLYRNRGDGTFEDVIAESFSRIPYYAMGADFGDINGDGLEDFWVADMAPYKRSRYKRTLESHRHVYEGDPSAVPHQYMQNALLLNLTGERFTEIAGMAGLHRTDWTWASRLVDMDNDGRLDAFSTNGMLRNFNDGDLGMRLAGRHNQRQYAQVFGPQPVLEEANLVFRNQGDARFREMGGEWGLSKMGVSFGAAFADLGGNGTLDLVIGNLKEPPSVYRNTGTKGSRLLIALRGVDSNHFGIGARVEVFAGDQRQVRMLSPQRGYMSSDAPILHFGLAEAETVDEVTIRWPSGRVQRLNHLAVNRRYTIKESGERTPQGSPVSSRFSRASAQFPTKAARKDPGSKEFLTQPLLPFPQARFLVNAVSGDLNSDGIADLILGGASGQESTVLIGGEDLVFREVWSLDLEEDFPSSDSDLAVGDFDGDESLDLVASSGGSSLAKDDIGYQDRVYFGDGKGEFRRDFDGTISEENHSTGAIAAGDFDNDGVLDLFVGGGAVPGRYPEIEESKLWRGTGDGAFESVELDGDRKLSEIGRVTDAVWADFDVDDYPDLVVSREWGPPLLWLNREGVLSLEADAFGGEERSGIWTTVEVGDFDGDGVLDLASGNLGLNSGGLWNPSKESRHLWWKGVGKEPQLIETHEIEGVEWPLVWRDRIRTSEIGRRVSTISYTDFANRSVSELFGDLEDQQFQSLSINEPRSGVFWGQGEGRFEFEAFPWSAQSGRVFDLLVADFNQDGVQDIMAAVEPPSLAPWTGRSEDGHIILLLGSRDRRFKSELPLASGLDVGDRSPRKLLWDDFDGDGREELAITFVEGEPLVFELEW